MTLRSDCNPLPSLFCVIAFPSSSQGYTIGIRRKQGEGGWTADIDLLIVWDINVLSARYTCVLVVRNIKPLLVRVYESVVWYMILLVVQDINLLLDLLGPGGKLVYVGLPASTLEFNVPKLVFGGKR
jgi:hypothetical protein